MFLRGERSPTLTLWAVPIKKIDAELMEDRRRLAWSRHPQGSLVVSALRMMALCILAVARKLSRFGYSEETPSWGQRQLRQRRVRNAPAGRADVSLRQRRRMSDRTWPSRALT